MAGLRSARATNTATTATATRPSSATPWATRPGSPTTPQGRQLTRTLPLGFGPDGKAGTADDATLPEGNFTERFEYDARGRQTLHVSFEGAVTQDIYSPTTGRLSSRRFFVSESAYAGGTGSPAQTWTYTYDAFGRTVQVDQVDLVNSSANRTTTTTYDGEGRTTRVASPEGAVNHEYDNLGRLVRTTTGAANAPLDDTRYAYDAAGRLSTVTVYGRNGVTLAANARETTTYAYTLSGNLLWKRSPDGGLAVYTYDAMDRLDTLTYYAPGAEYVVNHLDDFDIRASYDYAVRADGRRIGATETVWFDGGAGYASPHTSNLVWGYDDLGRLVDESIDHYVNSLDRNEHFIYDLAGNRRSLTLDLQRDGSVDESTAYAYDANDRLITEALDAVINADDRTTTYGYDHTQQTVKDVYSGSTHISLTNSAYDLPGRLKVVTITSYSGGSPSHVERTTYAYDAAGIRVDSLNEINANPGVDAIYETVTRTTYLNDNNNATGYSQVVRETTTSGGQTQKVIVYTLGLDQLSQATIPYSAGLPGPAVVYHFIADGHGSTRALLDSAGAIAITGVVQVFDFDAYGNLFNLDPAQAATSVLYSGEMFDARIGQQYLRARWYDAKTGRFGSLDPFFGDLENPLSINKYTYAHGEPIGLVDPSGEDSISTLSAVGWGLNLISMQVNVIKMGMAASKGDAFGAALHWNAFLVDVFFLALPFIGPGARGGLAFASILGNGSSLAASLSTIGVFGASLRGYITNLLIVLSQVDFPQEISVRTRSLLSQSLVNSLPKTSRPISRESPTLHPNELRS